ncbi:RHS repeat-associated core domain-containing protein [Kribbella sp. NPDC004138]
MNTTDTSLSSRGRRLAILLVAASLVGALVTPSAAADPPENGAASLQPTFDPPKPLVAVPGEAVRPRVPARSGMPTTPAGAAAVTWPSPGTAMVNLAVRARTALTRAGDLPVQVGAARGTAPGSVRVQVHPRADAVRRGVAGLLLSVTTPERVAGTVRVVVDYSGFADAYGGNWADRLTLTTILGAPGAVSNVRNDARAETVTAEVDPGQATMFAVAAAPDGSTGDYQATSLASSGSWQTNLSSGGFSWQYALQVPPTPGGLEPELALNYSSQAVDGRVVAQNNQPSWIGEGWDLWPGYIERTYKSCAEDLGGNNGTTKTGDQCWETENATVSSRAVNGKLVKGADGRWRPQADDASRVEHVTGAVNGDKDGEYWVVTSTDGTKYYFGLNRLPGWASGNATTNSVWTVPVYGNDADEPCHAATFAESACTQAYRWNLDYVVDVHGNSMSYFYTQESNKYGQNLGKTTTSYVRNGVLSEIHYGTRTGQDFGDVPAKVVFTPADRCVPGTDCAKHDKTSWPDVPWDLSCTATTCTIAQQAPSFWTTKRLAKVTTQVLKSDGTYRPVDQWDLTHTWPSPGDNTAAGLWLNSVRRTGLGKTTPVQLPAVTFTGTMYDNRVNGPEDGLPPLNKPRMTAIDTESGGRISITYATPNCVAGSRPAAETNTLRCFPVRWAMPPASEPVDDWFHKYVVAEVLEIDNLTSGASTRTTYEYTGGAAWAWDANPLLAAAKRTWSEWRGYENVVVRKGDPAQDLDKPRLKSAYRFFRGMNGDRLNRTGGTKSRSLTDSAGTVTDNKEYAGFQREEITYLDTTTEVSGEISTPWSHRTAVQSVLDTTLEAYQVESDRQVARTRLSSGDNRVTGLDRSFDEYGNVVKVDDQGDTAISGDEECTTTDYARNVAGNLVDLAERTVVESVACHPGAPLTAAIIAETRTSFDGNAYGATPTRGLATKSETAKEYSGDLPQFVATTSTYDTFGRTLTTTDALGRTTTFGYTQTRGLTTSSTTTNALRHTETTTLDTAWGVPTSTVDANGRLTTIGYDALGRRSTVYLPGRTPSDGAPNLRYGYEVTRTSGANWVRTERLVANGNTTVSYELFDGLLRPRQTQAPSPVAAGGRVLTTTTYDSRGLAVRTDEPYYDALAPGTDFHRPDGASVPGSTVSVYDGAGRVTATVKLAGSQELWRTTTSYGGDSVTVNPPEGDTVTTTVSDARGRITSKLLYHGRTPTGDADTTRYAYTKAGALEAVTDPAGNVWRFGYDLLGRKTSANDPDAGASTMTYDDAGQLLTTTDARGKTVATTYDALGRVVQTRTGSAAGPVLSEFSYDTLPAGKGILASATSYHDGHAYVSRTDSLDPAGRPLRTTVTIPPVTGYLELAGDYSTTYTYKPDGSLSGRTLPRLGDLSAETFTHTYDSLGLADRLTGATTYIDATAYNQVGEESSVVLGPKPAAGQPSTQVTRWSAFDPATHRLTQQQLTRVVDGSTTAQKIDYGYDPAGNVTRIVDHAAGSVADTQCYQYDYLRRVTQVWTQVTGCAETPSSTVVGGPAPYWQAFGYDVTGNRTSKTIKGLGGAADVVTSYAYPAPGPSAVRPHALTSATRATDTVEYGYDAAGHTVTRPGPAGTQTLDWDDAGRLARIRTATTETSYLYDASGAPLIRRDSGRATLFVGGGEVVLDTTSRVLTGRRYIEGVGVRTKADGVLYLGSDHHGTAGTAVKADDPASMDVRRMDLFGNPRSGSAGWRGGDRGFVSGTPTAGTGLTRLGAREYDPELGRFVSVDPIADYLDPQQLNGYAYANNNPATMSDATGLKYFIGDDVRRRPARGASADVSFNPAKWRQHATGQMRTGATSWDSGAARIRARRLCQAEAIACGIRQAKEKARLTAIASRNERAPLWHRAALKDARFDIDTSRPKQRDYTTALPAGLEFRAGLRAIGVGAAGPAHGLVGLIADLIGRSNSMVSKWAAIGDPAARNQIEGAKQDNAIAEFLGADDLLQVEMPSTDNGSHTDVYVTWARRMIKEGRPVWLATRVSSEQLARPFFDWEVQYAAMYHEFLDAGYTLDREDNALVPPG